MKKDLRTSCIKAYLPKVSTIKVIGHFQSEVVFHQRMSSMEAESNLIGFETTGTNSFQFWLLAKSRKAVIFGFGLSYEEKESLAKI